MCPKRVRLLSVTQLGTSCLQPQARGLPVHVPGATPGGVCVLQEHVLEGFFWSPKGSPSLQTSGMEMEGISVLLPAVGTRETFLIPQDTPACLGKRHLPGCV